MPTKAAGFKKIKQYNNNPSVNKHFLSIIIPLTNKLTFSLTIKIITYTICMPTIPRLPKINQF